MPDFESYDWICLTHDHKWFRDNDQWTTPRHCPAWLEQGGEGVAEDCEVTTIGDHEAAMQLPEPEDRERSTFWD